VYADPFMVETILRNLLSNAIKFTPRHGAITVACECDHDPILIKVSDTGVGMTKTQLDKLFKIRGSDSTMGTEKEKGTGLGLLLCDEFAQMNGGAIKVESQKGEGSTFTLELPANGCA
jgi:signal transduction histidine kinase